MEMKKALGKSKIIVGLISTSILLLGMSVTALGHSDNASTAPVAQWHFDEGTGKTACDSSGNKNNGKISGAAWVQGKVGKALKFDGNDYIQVPHKAILNPTTSLTVEAWVNPSGTRAWERIISKSSYPNADYALLRGDKNNVGIAIKMGKIVRSVYSAKNSVPVGVWSYIAATYDGEKIILYINGEKAGCLAIKGKINKHQEEFVIGRGAKNICGSYFKGLVDEVAVYNKVLSKNEIVNHYNAGAQNVAKAPKFLSAGVTSDGKKVLVAFDKEMASLPVSPAGFRVKVDGDKNIVKAVALNTDKKIVELSLTDTIRAAEKNIKLYYNNDAGVKAANRKALAELSGVSVTNYSKVGLTYDSTLGNNQVIFNKKNPGDLTVSLKLNGNTLTGIKNGTTALVNGTDYTISNSVVTIKSTYLSKLDLGTDYLTFDFSTGKDAKFEVKIIDKTIKVAAPNIVGITRSTDGKKVLVTFDKKMAALPGSPAGFGVSVNNKKNNITAVTLSNNNTTVELTLSDPVYKSAKMKVSYLAGKVKAEDGGSLANFTITIKVKKIK